jgi:hypothetical protein
VVRAPPTCCLEHVCARAVAVRHVEARLLAGGHTRGVEVKPNVGLRGGGQRAAEHVGHHLPLGTKAQDDHRLLHLRAVCEGAKSAVQEAGWSVGACVGRTALVVARVQ